MVLDELVWIWGKTKMKMEDPKPTQFQCLSGCQWPVWNTTCLQELYSFAQSSFTELCCALTVQVQTQVQTGSRLPKNKVSCLGKRKTTYLEPMLCWWAGWMLGNGCIKSFLVRDVSALPTTVFRTCGAKLLSWSFMGGMDWPLLSWWEITHDFFGWVS